MISRIFKTLAICVIAFWVTVKVPNKMCSEAYCYIQNTPLGTVVLASLEHYEWGWYWRVYKRSELDWYHGTVKTKAEAKAEIDNILLGSRII